MSREEYLRIGLITKPHGIHGALKLLSLTFDNSRFNALKTVFLEQKSDHAHVPVNLESVNTSDVSVTIKIAGINSREEAEKVRGAYICVKKSDAAKLPEGQYLIVDLIGCDVSDTDNKEYGKLTEVYQTGANDVYEIKGETTLLIPALKKLLNTVDIKNKQIILNADVLAEVGLFEGSE